MSHHLAAADCLPCPFCGGQPLFSVLGSGPIPERVIRATQAAAIECSRCGVLMPAPCWADAILKWNSNRTKNQ